MRQPIRGHSVRVLLDPADRLEPGARWVNSSTDQYAPALRGEFGSQSIRLQARPNTAPQFCRLEIVNAVLTVGGVAFEKAGAHRATLRADPARARHGPTGGIASRCKRSRTRVYWSVYELTHRAPGSRRAAGSRKHSNGVPRICCQTIFIGGKPQWYGKPLKQRGLLSRRADTRRVIGANSVSLRQRGAVSCVADQLGKR